MNNQNTRTRYVHVNSKHRLAGDLVLNTSGNLVPEDRAEINIHLNNPIKNVWRVAVKSFTIANSFFNVKTGENRLVWYEFFKPAGAADYVKKKFYIDIPPAYYNVAELLVKINFAIDSMAAFQHRVISEDPMNIELSQDTDNYTVRVNLTIASGDKWFLPVQENDAQTMWSSLGFTDHQILTHRRYAQPETEDTLTSDISHRLKEAGYGGLGSSDVITQAGSDLTSFNLVSKLPATIENSGGLYLISDALTTGSTYESRKHPDKLHTEAVPMNILEWIQFEVDRYSWVHFNANTVHWHYLNNASIADFDIVLKSQSGQTLTHKECGNYNLVLVFETIEQDEVSASFIRQYNKEGYAIAHTPDHVRK